MQNFSDLFGISKRQLPPKSFIRMYGNGGQAGSGASIFYFESVFERAGADIELINSASAGTLFKIHADGFYHMRFQYTIEAFATVGSRYAYIGWTKNAPGFSGTLPPLTTVLAQNLVPAIDAIENMGEATCVAFLKAGDQIFPSFSGVGITTPSADGLVHCAITRIA